MSEACEALGLPVDRRQRQLLQRVARRRHRPDAGRRRARPHRRARRAAARRRGSCAGEPIVVLGETRAELGGSEWAAVVHGLDGGMPPVADLDRAGRLHDARRASSSRGALVDGVHDCATAASRSRSRRWRSPAAAASRSMPDGPLDGRRVAGRGVVLRRVGVAGGALGRARARRRRARPGAAGAGTWPRAGLGDGRAGPPPRGRRAGRAGARRRAGRRHPRLAGRHPDCSGLGASAPALGIGPLRASACPESRCVRLAIYGASTTCYAPWPNLPRHPGRDGAATVEANHGRTWCWAPSRSRSPAASPPRRRRRSGRNPSRSPRRRRPRSPRRPRRPRDPNAPTTHDVAHDDDHGSGRDDHDHDHDDTTTTTSTTTTTTTTPVTTTTTTTAPPPSACGASDRGSDGRERGRRASPWSRWSVATAGCRSSGMRRGHARTRGRWRAGSVRESGVVAADVDQTVHAVRHPGSGSACARSSGRSTASRTRRRGPRRRAATVPVTPSPSIDTGVRRTHQDLNDGRVLVGLRLRRRGGR